MTSFKSTLGLILLGWSLLHSPASAAKWNLRGLGVNFSTDAPTDSPVLPDTPAITIEVSVDEEPVEEDPEEEESEDEEPEEEPSEEEPSEEEPVEEEPAEPEATDAPLVDLATLAASTPELSLLLDLVVAAGLDIALTTPGPYTVFAPTNDAIAAAVNLDAEVDPLALFQLLTYHVIPGQMIMSSDIVDGSEVTTLQGEVVVFDVEEFGIVVNDADIIQADIVASNGVVHIIDRALVPQALLNTPEAPAAGTIEGELAEDTDLSIMSTLVVQTDLAAILNSTEGDYTVFAPTNEAFFSAMTQFGIDPGLDYDPAVFEPLLEYHVVNGTYVASDITDGMTLSTLQGGSILFGVSEEDGVTVNGANVLVGDIPASNGLIHKIDAALVPGTVIAATP